MPRGLLCAVVSLLAVPGSRVVARGLSCSAASAIFPDLELNPCFSIGRQRFLATESREAPQLGFLQLGVKCHCLKLKSVRQQHK